MTVYRFSKFDSEMMSLAIKLAAKGICTTTPNPNVGCIIVDKHNQIVGRGWHQKAGSPHAEVHALMEAGQAAKGGTAYVTLEPCSHFGRTPPCAQALVDAGVGRVVAAMVDPNPKVAGKGLALLAEHKIEVASGLMAEQAELLNRGFVTRMKTGKPWVTVKLASSLDGKTALANGKSQWITGPLARQDVQRHRATSCAILSGSGTVIADNPSLNVRFDELGEWDKIPNKDELRQPIRIVLDGKNQLTGDFRLFDLPGRKVVINRSVNSNLKTDVEQIQVAANGNKLDLKAVMQELGKLEINNLWVEAGGLMAGALLQNKLVDELILYQAPKLLGDRGQNLFVMEELTQMQQATMLEWSSIKRIGDDVKMQLLLSK